MNYPPNNNPNQPYNQPYNQNFNGQGFPVRQASKKPKISMIGSIICAVLAAIAIFMPVLSVNSDFKNSTSSIIEWNTFEFSFLSDGKDEYDSINKSIDRGISGKMKDVAESEKMLIVASTIAIFALAFTVVGVIVGKVRERNGGGKKLALIAAVIGLCAAVFLMIATISLVGNYNDLTKTIVNKDVLSVGSGAIMITMASVGTLIFCVVGKDA